MKVQDLRQKYIGKIFRVKETGITGSCIQVSGCRREDRIVIRFCLSLEQGNVWYISDDIEPVKETLF